MKLNKIHEEDSIYWKKRFSDMKFENRIKPINDINDNNLKITLLKSGDDIMGYCFSSIKNDVGEVESIFIEEQLRHHNFGREILGQHISWFKNRKCIKIVVSVSHGHESVFKFYNKMGFYEKRIELEYRDIY
jgi:ribosomal protein S18 acetylase RimI-like enzyme